MNKYLVMFKANTDQIHQEKIFEANSQREACLEAFLEMRKTHPKITIMNMRFLVSDPIHVQGGIQ